MQVKEVFQNFMRRIKIVLNDLGYTCRIVNNFYQTHPLGNTAVINFQKSLSRPAFTLNIGVYSRALGQFFNLDLKQAKITPKFYDCHWNKPIGAVYPDNLNQTFNEDDWWFYDEKTNIDTLVTKIKICLEVVAIPAIEQHFTDEQLKNMWLAKADASEGNRLKYLSALLRINNREEQLKSVLREIAEYLKKNPESIALKAHYDRLQGDTTQKLMDQNASLELPHNSARTSETAVLLQTSDMQPKEVFQCLMQRIKLFMKQYDYTTINNNFYYHHFTGNVGVINFQRHKDQWAFTVNLGVYSLELAKFFMPTMVKPKPYFYECHWHEPMKLLRKDLTIVQTADSWIFYLGKSNINELFQEICDYLLTPAVLIIEQRISDQRLQQIWFGNEKSAELKGIEYLHLCVLLKLAKNVEKFILMVEKFKNYLANKPQLKVLKKDFEDFLNRNDVIQFFHEKKSPAVEDQPTISSPTKKLKLS
jgi:hypothetical protein